MHVVDRPRRPHTHSFVLELLANRDRRACFCLGTIHIRVRAQRGAIQLSTCGIGETHTVRFVWPIPKLLVNIVHSTCRGSFHRHGLTRRLAKPTRCVFVILTNVVITRRKIITPRAGTALFCIRILFVHPLAQGIPKRHASRNIQILHIVRHIAGLASVLPFKTLLGAKRKIGLFDLAIPSSQDLTAL